jgi:hypothetical protein
MRKNLLLLTTFAILGRICFPVIASPKLTSIWGTPGEGVIGRALENGTIRKGNYIYQSDLDKGLNTFLCFSTGEIIKSGEKTSCPLPKKLVEYKKERSRCLSRKSITLYRPYGVGLLSRPTIISWAPVLDAKFYTVWLQESEDNSVLIDAVKGTSIPFPPKLLFDSKHSTYSVLIVARKSQDRLDDLSEENRISTNRVISYQNDNKYLSETFEAVKKIEALKLPTETLFTTDLRSIYTKEMLFEEFIPKLEVLAKRNNSSAYVKRSLADAYLTAHQPYLAVLAYYEALNTAKQQSQLSEVERIAEQLNYIFQADPELKAFVDSNQFEKKYSQIAISQLNVPSLKCG